MISAGDGKTAIRGSYGIFYDRMMGSVTSVIDGATPGFSQAANSFPNRANNEVRISDSALGMPQAPDAPQLALPLTRSTTISIANPNLRTGYVQSYTFGIQRQIAANTVLDVSWVGNRGVKLFMFRDVNQPQIYGDLLPAFKEIQAFVSSGAAPSAGNTLVRIFGSPATVVSTFGATTFKNGLVGNLVNTLDRTQYRSMRPPASRTRICAPIRSSTRRASA